MQSMRSSYRTTLLTNDSALPTCDQHTERTLKERLHHLLRLISSDIISTDPINGPARERIMFFPQYFFVDYMYLSRPSTDRHEFAHTFGVGKSLKPTFRKFYSPALKKNFGTGKA